MSKEIVRDGIAWGSILLAVISGGWTYLHNRQDSNREQSCIEEIRAALEYNNEQWKIALEIAQGER